jgi:fimbrial isopeptide formation D2 family protein
MKITKSIAHLAVTAGLTAVLSFGGVMAPVSMAFAAEGATTEANSITITQNANNKDAIDPNKKTQFIAYQIFNAKVDDENGSGRKVVSDVTWAIEDVQIQNQIIDAIKKSIENDPSESQLPTKPTAQNVAEWMAANLQSASGVVNDGDLLDKIADLLKGATPTKPKGATSAAFAADGPVSFENSGYYLFLTDNGSIGGKDNYSGRMQTGTSPIFAVVGGSAVVVTEKTGIPTVTKKIKDDKPGSHWADKADSQVGQNVQYQLTGTVAENVASFNTYYYEFYDELSAGLIADKDSVHVTVYANNEDTSGTEVNLPAGAVEYNTTGNNNVLTVKFNDLKAVTAKTGSSAISITKDSRVVVTYLAKLNPAKIEKVTVGGRGNDNEVKLIYSNNPMSEGKGESVPDTVRDYTYALQLVKEDFDDNNKKLKDVEFTIKATGADELASGTVGTQFVQENGSLGGTEHKFKTNENGEISVTGLDAGTYTVHEVENSNPGYNTLPDFTFTITAEGLDKLEGETLAGNAAPNTLKVTAEQNDSTLVTPSVNDGTVTLTIQNKKGSNLPLTGLNGVTFTWIAGGAVLCIGVAHLIRSRKRDDGSEE